MIDKPEPRIIESTVTHHPDGCTDHRLRYIDDACEYQHWDITWWPGVIKSLDSTRP